MKLNLGAGKTVIEGFTPIDRSLGSEVYPLTDYADGSVEEIRASHILEHFSHTQLVDVLQEWVRVLKPGGRIWIAVPDFDWIADHRSEDPKAMYYLMGGHTDENDYHKSAFNEKGLREAMERYGGLCDIKKWISENIDCASLPCSLNLSGVKPEDWKQPKKSCIVKVTALTSIPRVGWNDHFGCIIDALKPIGINLMRVTGAYWGQCLQNGLEKIIADGVEWAITIDYDTMFAEGDVVRLLQHMAEHPEIGALAAMQNKRSSDGALIWRDDAKTLEWTVGGPPVEVHTAHFGLTVIRLDLLAKTPKPWLVGEPGPDGSWTHKDRKDPDIYFWHNWREAGHTVYVAPDVRVGHLEVMVSEFNEQMEVVHTHVKEWKERVDASGSIEA